MLCIAGLILGQLIFLMVFATSAYSRDVTFAWVENPEDIDGYRLYYKSGSSGPPYDGRGAKEGPSPVETGNVTSFTLTGLSNIETYYFALTAYRGTLESDYTSEIALPPQENTAPMAFDSAIIVIENIQYSGSLSATDADNDPLTYLLVSNPEKGTVAIIDNEAGSFTYTPLPDTTGSDIFTFKVSDGTADSAVATVDVSILEINGSPTANPASITVAEDSIFEGQLSGSDRDGDPLSFSIAGNGTKVTASITNRNTGAFSYEPEENATGRVPSRPMTADLIRPRLL
ncbi:Ig-like domain-containing protein [Desulfopila inferna]|uniref:Ig-like domain-containing protein n=1 Tax=Desulfopila inferna TaxID=468528 RepID=UPI00196517DD|nr:Ig-like domain-containing protein [Desulfopila inferna]